MTATTTEFPRPLTEREADVLHALLALDFEGAEDLRQQAKVATAVARCVCGCATIDLEVDKTASKPAKVSRSPVPAEGSWSEGGIILFVIEGWLSLLEIWTWGDDLRREFPPPIEIKFSLSDS